VAARVALAGVLHRWRQWDTLAARRVDRYVANSETTRQRVGRYFGRDAEVVHPPVETERFAAAAAERAARGAGAGDACVVLSELMPHKRIDVAVAAFTALGLPLVVVGNGPDARRLRRMAGPTVTFAGRVGDAEAAALLAGARAFVVTATEEFGIAAVEAQAAGRPVLALRAGGVRETVLDGITGAFFEEPTPEALAAAVARFDADAYDPAACAANAQRFDAAHFRHGMQAIVTAALAGERAPREPPTRRRRASGGLARLPA